MRAYVKGGPADGGFFEEIEENSRWVHVVEHVVSAILIHIYEHRAGTKDIYDFTQSVVDEGGEYVEFCKSAEANGRGQTGRGMAKDH